MFSIAFLSYRSLAFLLILCIVTQCALALSPLPPLPPEEEYSLAAERYPSLYATVFDKNLPDAKRITAMQLFRRNHTQFTDLPAPLMQIIFDADESADVRVSAFNLHGRYAYNDPAYLDWLWQIAEERTAPAPLRSIALIFLGHPESIDDAQQDRLRKIVLDSSEPEQVRDYALSRLIDYAPPKTLFQFLRDLVGDRSQAERLRASALYHLGRSYREQPEVFKLLMTLANDHTEAARVRSSAISQLRSNQPDREGILPLLLQIAKEPSTPPEVRASTLAAVGEYYYKSEGILALLTQTALDAEQPEEVRRWAIASFDNIRQPSIAAKQTLRQIAEDTSAPPELRGTAISRLATHEDYASEITPILISLALNPAEPLPVRRDAIGAATRDLRNQNGVFEAALQVLQNRSEPEELRTQTAFYINLYYKKRQETIVFFKATANNPNETMDMRIEAIGALFSIRYNDGHRQINPELNFHYDPHDLVEILTAITADPSLPEAIRIQLRNFQSE